MSYNCSTKQDLVIASDLITVDMLVSNVGWNVLIGLSQSQLHIRK